MLLRCESLEPPISWVNRVISTFVACPVRPNSGHSANARVYECTP